MSMTQRFVKMWVIIVSCCFAAVLVAVLPFALQGDDTPRAITVNSVAALMGLSAVSLVCGLLLYRIWSPSTLRQTHANGLSTSATVVEVSATGWRARGSTSGRRNERPVWLVQQGGVINSSTYRKHEYKVRLQVSRSMMPTYEAITFQLLAEDQVPKLGDNIMVKVHPRYADIVIMQIDSLGQE